MNHSLDDIVKEMLTTLAHPEVEVVKQHDPDINLVIFSVTLDDPENIIGRRGETLRSLNHIIRKIVEERSDEETQAELFFVDVNGYYTKRIEELKMRANIVAERVRSFSRDIELDPMSSYERFLVHTYLGNLSGIATYSTGTGKERRVVVTTEEAKDVSSVEE